MQTLGDSRAAEYMKGRKTLEINPEHPIVQALKQKVDSDASGAKVGNHNLSCTPHIELHDILLPCHHVLLGSICRLGSRSMCLPAKRDAMKTEQEARCKQCRCGHSKQSSCPGISMLGLLLT